MARLDVVVDVIKASRCGDVRKYGSETFSGH